MKDTGYTVFHEGDLVKILVNKTFTNDGLATATTCDKGITVYSNIGLCTYPSSADFKGKEVACFEGQTATIVRKIGRPSRIKSDDAQWAYDVYEILLMGEAFQIFANNIKLICRVTE